MRSRTYDRLPFGYSRNTHIKKTPNTSPEKKDKKYKQCIHKAGIENAFVSKVNYFDRNSTWKQAQNQSSS